MKKLSTYLFLVLFSFQTSSWADDIRDFQIEGMSIGDSLLDYFSEEEILQSKKNYYKNDKFITVDLSYIFNSSMYDHLQISYQNNNDFTIYEIESSIEYTNKIDTCNSKRIEIFEEVSTMFPNSEKTDLIKRKASFDKTGNSIIIGRQLYFKNTDYIQVACFDMSETLNNKGWIDSLKVVLTSRKFADWRTKNTKNI